MVDLTRDVMHKTSPEAGRRSYVVANGVQLFAGALVGTNAAGFLVKWGPDTAGHRFVGILLAGVTGNTAATPPVEGRVDESGVTIKSTPLSGATQADVNSLVYCATDNIADASFTVPTNVKAIGWVSRFVSSGVVDITLFPASTHLAL